MGYEPNRLQRLVDFSTMTRHEDPTIRQRPATRICGLVPVPWYDAWSAFPRSGNTSVRFNQTPVGWKPPSFSGIFVPVNGSRTAQRRQGDGIAHDFEC